MTNKLIFQPLAAISTMLCVSTSFAQQRGQPVQIGESSLFPSAEVRFLSNSNAFLTPDNEIDASAVALSPRLEWLAQRRLLDISLVYEGDYASYSEENLDFDDHLLNFSANAELGARQRVKGSLEVSREHEVLGTLITRGVAGENTEQVELTNLEAQLSFQYGARSARGNIEVGLRLASENFTNQENLTDGRDFTEIAPFGVFSYRLSSDSRLTLEAEINDLSYDEEVRDRTDVTALVGISLGENRKTSGTARIGYTQAGFDQNGRGDENAAVADVSLTWRPKDFSRFDLTLRREFDNSDATAAQDITVGDLVRLDWVHNWSTRFRTEAFVSRVARDRECPDLGTATTSAGLEAGFSVRRWLVLGAGVSAASRTSDDCPVPDPNDEGLDFDRGLGNIFLRATL